MVSFRRFALAIAVLALFAGLASAQVNISTVGSASGSLICTANVANPTFVRAEGYAELVGDIVIACTGGAFQAAGTSVPTANITVSLNNTFVTSRIMNNGASEALLLIDEPNAAPGAGAGFPFNPCTSVSQGAGPGGCPEVVGTATPTAPPGPAVYSATPGAGAAPYNVFYGIVNSNTVTFNGVPVLAPVTAGLARVFRITNIRAAVANIGGGGAFQGTGGILASVTMSNGLLVQQPSFTVASIFTGLNTAIRSADLKSSSASTTGGGALLQCSSLKLSTGSGVGILRFTEGFANAFKTRVAPTSSVTGAGTLANSISPVAVNTLTQNVPGLIYAGSESGFILPTPNGTAGLADFGTRLKATFNNIPTGVTLYVTTTNINPTGAVNTVTLSGATTQNALLSNAIPTSTNGLLAGLVISETAGVQGVGGGQTGFLPFLGPTSALSSNGLTLTQLTPDANGTATAVWEILQANPAQSETAEFGVFYSFTGNQLAGTPPITPTATVSMSFAPTVSSYNASSAIPRFAPGTSSTTIINVALCQTVLLFPFVNTAPGFDTGISIANTTADVSPFSTKNQTGACTLNFFGTGAGTTTSAPFPSAGGNIAPGTLNAEQVSNIRNGFTGYVIAVCNFQLAHGYALFSDTGIRNWATGYLALVVPTSTVGNARLVDESLGN